MFLVKLGQGSNFGVWVERGRQLVGEILRKRAAQTAKGRFPNANESKVQQQQANINSGILRCDVAKQDRSILARFTHQFHTQAAQLRRSAAMRMMAPSRRGNLVGFAFVGLALAHESQQKGDEDIKLMPLDVCCEIIKSTFQKPAIMDDPAPSEFPSDLASYDLCPQLLGKGCNASIYAARVHESQHTLSLNPSSDDLDSFEVIPIETSLADSDTNVSDDDSEASFIVLNAGECESAGTGTELKPELDETFDLAIKMMFNYDAASNALAISRAFEKEYLPLQQLPDHLCQAGMLQWQNGNHVKKKRKTLEPHANIIAMYHTFAAPVDVHDLNEARDMFPAALPKRMHADGFGRNMTMFIVMKRYDMTLTEYLQTVGCQSQHVAMVIVAQLLEGVSHLVANRVAHRDLKGNNILVNIDPAGGSPHVVLADFGCCLADSDVNLVLPYPSHEMCIGGNTALMAPETQPGLHAHINYSKTDTWAIGAIAYEVLGLRNPFYRHGNQSGLDSGTYQESELPLLPDNTHPTLARVVRLLLRKDPSKRPTPQVAADMLHLSLWQPEWWKNACWESGQLLPTQRHITNWLLLVSMTTLGCNASMEGCNWKLWQNAAELQLCKSWLSRVRDYELMQAVGTLHGIKQ